MLTWLSIDDLYLPNPDERNHRDREGVIGEADAGEHPQLGLLQDAIARRRSQPTGQDAAP